MKTFVATLILLNSLAVSHADDIDSSQIPPQYISNYGKGLSNLAKLLARRIQESTGVKKTFTPLDASANNHYLVENKFVRIDNFSVEPQGAYAALIDLTNGNAYCVFVPSGTKENSPAEKTYLSQLKELNDKQSELEGPQEPPRFEASKQ